MPKKQIAVYLRLSLEDTGANDESNSITAQRGIIAQFIQGPPEFASMKTVEFVDDGYSGTNFDRPGFRRMMAMVRSGDVSCIIVKDLSRFARNYIEAGDYLEHIFPYLGIRWSRPFFTNTVPSGVMEPPSEALAVMECSAPLAPVVMSFTLSMATGPASSVLPT